MLADLYPLILNGLALLLVLSVALRLWRRGRKLPPLPQPCRALLLFEGETLAICEGETAPLLAGGRSRSQCFAHLGQSFPSLALRMEALAEGGQETIEGLVQGERLVVLLRGDLCRIELHQDASLAATPAERTELSLLREAIAQSPQMIWRSNSQGDVTWANASYLDALPEAPKRWPLPALFEEDNPVQTLGARSFRAKDLASAQGDTLHFATEITAERAAETQRQAFLDTLSDIYAGLPFGIAIFDTQSQLLHFNPALVDLTDLPLTELIARPSLARFLNIMRENHTLPEPRHYTAWAEEFMASEEGYSERWYLPSGKSLEVFARRYPAGLFALVLQDSTARSRQQQLSNSENRLLRASLQDLNEGVAIFDGNGLLLHANPPYNRLRGLPDAALLAPDFEAECGHWRNLFDVPLAALGWHSFAKGRIFLGRLPEGGTLLRVQHQAFAAHDETEAVTLRA